MGSLLNLFGCTSFHTIITPRIVIIVPVTGDGAGANFLSMDFLREMFRHVNMPQAQHVSLVVPVVLMLVSYTWCVAHNLSICSGTVYTQLSGMSGRNGQKKFLHGAKFVGALISCAHTFGKSQYMFRILDSVMLAYLSLSAFSATPALNT